MRSDIPQWAWDEAKDRSKNSFLSFDLDEAHEVVARALLDAHQRGRQVGMEWQPIETAPRDGTNILCFAHGSHGPTDTYYGVAQWAVDGPGKIQPHVEGWFWPFAIRPTHWIPLPEPPAAIQAKAQDTERGKE